MNSDFDTDNEQEDLWGFDAYASYKEYYQNNRKYFKKIDQENELDRIAGMKAEGDLSETEFTFLESLLMDASTGENVGWLQLSRFERFEIYNHKTFFQKSRFVISRICDLLVLWFSKRFDLLVLWFSKRFDHIGSWLDENSEKRYEYLAKKSLGTFLGILKVFAQLSFVILKIVSVPLYVIVFICAPMITFVLFWAIITAPFWIIALIVYSCG